MDAGQVLFAGKFFCAIDEDGNAIFTEDYAFPLSTGLGGHGHWESEVNYGGGSAQDPGSMVSPWAAGATLVDAAAELSSGARIAVSNSAVTQVALSPVVGTWAAVTPATAGIAWGACAGGPITEKWVIGGAGGQIESSQNGSVWTARTSGLAANPILCMEHNKLSSGSPKYVAMTTSEVAHSSDGITWSVASHGLTSNPRALAYSHGYAEAPDERWVAMLENGTDVAYSDDQGATWTQLTSVLSGWGGGTFKKASIASDGFGVFVATLASSTGNMMWASIDNGETWTRVQIVPGAGGSSSESISMGAAYGASGDDMDGGGFVAVGADGIIYTPIMIPLGA
jgi:hypothetical protein